MSHCSRAVSRGQTDRNDEANIRKYVVNALKNIASKKNSGYPKRDSKGTPPEHRINAIPLEPNFLAHFNITL